MPQINNTTPNPLQSLSEFQSARGRSAHRPSRRPTPEQGQALECLGHAIDYLIDESLLAGGSVATPLTAAVHLLSDARREGYLRCAALPRDSRARSGRTTHLLWKWMPASPSLLPVFRSREVHKES